MKLKLNEKGGWQQLVLPLDDFFKKMGTPDALDIVGQYETWDGVQDAKRHDKEYRPGARLAILASRSMGSEKGTLLLSDVLFYPSDEDVTSVLKTIRLDELLQEGEIDWGFNLGQEFPGAKGGRLRSTMGGISLGVSVEPALLLYHDPQQGLAKALGTPALSLATAPAVIGEAATSAFVLTGQGLTAQSLRVICPPLWTTTVKQAGEDRLECTVRAPESTPAREARIHVQLLSAGHPIGELTVPLRVARTN